MTDFFQLFVSYCRALLGLLDRCVFTMYGIEVSLLAVITCLLITGFVISIFWKGATT